MPKIALDVMGGDNGFEPVVEGAIKALEEIDKSFSLVLVGEVNKFKSLIPSKFLDRVEFVNSTDVISMDEKATTVVKRENSSIYKAVLTVKNGGADAIVSMGHSGATMSISTLKLGRLKGVIRPALVCIFPSLVGKDTAVLDVGANTECTPEQLFGFAVMGEVFAKTILNLNSPKVGLLSNGEEDVKGNDLVKATFPLMKKIDSFIGNVEGKNLMDSSVDIVITDGYTGNVALKVTEGTVKTLLTTIKDLSMSSFRGKLGLLLLKPFLKKIVKKISPDAQGGALLIGLKSCVVIGHGSGGSLAVKNAIDVALRSYELKVSSLIEKNMTKYNNK